jgi:hypothetical protein
MKHDDQGTHSVFRGSRLVAWVATALLLLPSVARPCSMCRCGDPTFNALGKDGFAARGFHVAMDAERFDKTEGTGADAESQVEQRYTLFGSYGLGERLTLSGRVPLSNRNLDTISAGVPGTIHTTGLGDPEIQGQLRLWSSQFSSLGRRASLTLTAGVKTPWGRNDVTQNGERVDEHAQPGTGALDLTGGLAYLFLLDRESALFASASYRHTGTNGHGYRYGSVLLANASYEHKLGSRFDGVLELNFRDAARDVVDTSGELDPDTGGSLLYVTPRLLVDLGNGVVLRTAAQIPTVRSLNGFQRERAVLSVGFTYLVGRR